jgi:hypothetical protein
LRWRYAWYEDMTWRHDERTSKLWLKELRLDIMMMVKNGTDLKEKRLLSPWLLALWLTVNIRDINVILSGLRPTPINGWTVTPYCSRYTVIALASLPHFHLPTSQRYQWNINIMNIYSCLWNENIKSLLIYHHYLHSFVFNVPSSIFIYRVDEGMSFMTFVWRSLYPKGNNVSKDEGF